MVWINNKEKYGEVRFDFINDVDTLLYFFKKHANSEAAGKVTSCAEKDFKSGQARVGGFGMYACHTLIGAVSYEVRESKLNIGLVTGKLDLVASVAEVRGQGIGSILMGSLFLRLANFYGPYLCQLSTTAVHPAVVNLVEKLGFTTVNPNSEGPLYTIDFKSSDKLLEFNKKCDANLYQRISKIRLNCISCMSVIHPKSPWCT